MRRLSAAMPPVLIQVGRPTAIYFQQAKELVPHQSIERRLGWDTEQRPFIRFFGHSDSRKCRFMRPSGLA